MRKGGKTSSEKSAVERIRALQRSNPANKRCADCVELGPTYICLDFRTFVCQYCSGIHREFGHKIKGISLSQWTAAEVEELEGAGNEAAAQVWLARWKKEESPEPSGGDIEKVRTFLRQKYKEKRWWDDRPVQAKQEKINSSAPSETPKVEQAVVVKQAPPEAPPQDLLGFSSDTPVSNPPLATSTSSANTSVSLFELEPSVTNTGSVLSIQPPASTSSSLLEIDATNASETRLLQSSSIAPAAAQWTADFSSPPAVVNTQPQNGGLFADFSAPPAVVNSQPQSGGLFDIDFSSSSAPSQEKALFGVDVMGNVLASADSQAPSSFAVPQGNNDCVTQASASAPIASFSESGESAGERLRQQLLNGNSTELNRLFEQSRQPTQTQPASAAERYAALQGNLSNLFSSSQQSNGLATAGFGAMGAPMMHSASPSLGNQLALPPAMTPSLGNQLALPPATSSSAPSGTDMWQQQSSWWQTGQSNGFVPSTMGQQQMPGWQNYGQPNYLPTPNAAPSTFSPPVGAPTSTPFPQMPSFGQQGGHHGQLGFMNGATGASLNAQPQTSNINAPQSKPSALDEPLIQSPPKESQFGDLLAAFTEKHPINGLTIMA